MGYMFTYQMVAKELNEILDVASLAKTAAYETMIHASTANDAMCETKMEDLKLRIREVNKMLTLLDSKIEHIKNQS